MFDRTSLQELHSLYVLSLNLNMQKTAEELNIPKPTLQTRLDTLERRLSGRVFERSQKSGAMSLTSFGETVFNKIKQLLWAAQSLSFEKIFSNGKIIPITIISNPSFLETYVSPNVSKFLESHSSIVFSFKNHYEPYYQPHNLNEIFIGASENDPDYSYSPLFTSIPKLWASKNYLKNNLPIKTELDLKNHVVIASKEDVRNHSILKRICPIRVINTPDIHTTHILALNHTGIIVESEDVAHKLNLIPVFPSLSGTSIQLNIKTNKDFLKFPCAQAIVRWIQKESQ